MPPKGVLLCGLWGCGKSLSTKALASAWRLPLIKLEMGRLRSSGVGESEANVYRVINLVEGVAPCILFADEAEKTFSGGASSAYSDAGTTSRILGIFSNWLQETKSHICLAMTANSLENLPTELINRANERWFFDLPTEEERVDIIKIHVRKAGQDPDRFNLAELSEAAKYLVGREIEQAIGSAMMDSFDQNKDALDPRILQYHLESKPRIFKTMKDELKKLIDWVGWDEDNEEGVRARLASSRRSDSFKLVDVAESEGE